MAVRITTQYIKKLVPPDEGQRFYFDSERQGLALRITANGAISWVLNYSANGRKRRATIGRWPEWTVEAARDEASDLRRDLREGLDPLDAPKHEGESFTVNDLAKAYLEQHAAKNKRESSIINDKSMLDAIIKPHLGALTVRDVKQADVEKLHVSMKDRPYHANRVLSLLSTMFRFAIEKGWTDSNPARRPTKLSPYAGVRRYEEKKRKPELTPEQFASFEAALDRYSDQKAANALRLLALTGSRKSEVLRAEWTEFKLHEDDDTGVWNKPAERMKAKEDVEVPLTGPVLELLRKMEKQKGSSPYLFPGHGTDAPRENIRNCWRQVMRDAGLAKAVEIRGKKQMLTRWKPILRLHDLRHLYGSTLVSKGVPLEIIGKILGHKRVETTQRYARPDLESKRAAMGVMGNIWARNQANHKSGPRGSGKAQRPPKATQPPKGSQRAPKRQK